MILEKKSLVVIPDYWSQLASTLDKDQQYGRVLLLPKNFSPLDSYFWGYNGTFLSTQIMSKPSVGYSFGYGPSVQSSIYPAIDVLYDYLENGLYDKFLDTVKSFNIDTIIQRNDFDISANLKSPNAYQKSIGDYSDKKIKEFLDKSLSLDIKSGPLDIYRIPAKFKSPLIFSNDLSWKKINDTKFSLSLRNLNTAQDLSFLESYDSNWKLYLRKYNINQSCQKTFEYNEGKVVECWSDKKIVESEDFIYLYQKPVFDDTHKTVYNYANQWTISADFIKNNFSPKYYKKNPDGSINIELILYFKPQSYFYLGQIVSLIGFVCCIGYWGFYFIKRMRRLTKGRKNEIY